jgi:sulfite reductase alpha subunit-like flavoprotein
MISFFSRPFDAKNPFLATIKVNRELHKSGERSCMHIEFDIQGSKMRYDTGNANISVVVTIEEYTRTLELLYK